jgi:hypothetical protein
MVRGWTGKIAAPPLGFEPWKGVRLLDARGRVVADLEKDGQRWTEQQPNQPIDSYATCSLNLKPGAWFLRQHAPDGREVEQTLIVSPNWRTDVYLMIRPPNEGGSPPPRLSVLMHLPGTPWENPQDRQVDQARVALADERLVLNDEVDGLLLGKFDNPMAGIFGGHLLIVEQSRQPSARIEKLNDVVRNLRGLLGDNHPDVEALSLKCPDEKLRAQGPPSAPPMLEASWHILVHASQDQPKLVPPSLWRRIHAQTFLPPFLRWASDEKSKSHHVEALRHILTRSPEVIAAAATTGARSAGEVHVAASAAASQAPMAFNATAKPPGQAAAGRSLFRTPELRERLKLLGLPPSVSRVL